MKKQIYFLLFMSFLNIGCLIGQKDVAGKIYHDFQVDDLPSFENAPLEVSRLNRIFDNSTNLEEVFQEYFSTLLGKRFKLKKKLGMTTLSSAPPPNYLKTAKFIIEFDPKGNVRTVSFSGKKIFDQSDQMKVQQILQKSNFLPATKNGKPVSILLYYSISLDTPE